MIIILQIAKILYSTNRTQVSPKNSKSIIKLYFRKSYFFSTKVFLPKEEPSSVCSQFPFGREVPRQRGEMILQYFRPVPFTLLKVYRFYKNCTTLESGKVALRSVRPTKFLAICVIPSAINSTRLRDRDPRYLSFVYKWSKVFRWNYYVQPLNQLRHTIFINRSAKRIGKF